MSIFDSLLSRLYRQEFDLEEIKSSVSSKVDRFAREYLSPEAFRRYLDSAKSISYEIAYLPSTVVMYYDTMKNRFRTLVSGVLGLYDMVRNRIVLNRYTPKEQAEAVLAHERVHQATRDWAMEYFRRLGEAARPIVEGFTELITRGLGYATRAYDEYVKAAEQTIQRMGYNLREGLYRILNLKIDPYTVARDFSSLYQIRCQSCYR